MRHFAIALAAAVIGMLIALLLYDRLVVQPRDAARADAIAKATEINLAKAHSEADTIAANLDAQVQRSVSSAREAMDARPATRTSAGWHGRRWTARRCSRSRCPSTT